MQSANVTSFCDCESIYTFYCKNIKNGPFNLFPLSVKSNLEPLNAEKNGASSRDNSISFENSRKMHLGTLLYKHG